jgi:hypothetical protein
MRPTQPQPSSAVSVQPRGANIGYLVALLGALFGGQAVGRVGYTFVLRLVHSTATPLATPTRPWQWLALVGLAGVSAAATFRVAKTTDRLLAALLIVVALVVGVVTQVVMSLAR